jgi:hypothetical protein
MQPTVILPAAKAAPRITLTLLGQAQPKHRNRRPFLSRFALIAWSAGGLLRSLELATIFALVREPNVPKDGPQFGDLRVSLQRLTLAVNPHCDFAQLPAIRSRIEGMSE